jgi:16S rRNA (guanine527-N7)-methyltransferase
MMKRYEMSFKDILLEVMAEAGFDLTAEQVDQFVHYEEILLDWNERMNLTALTAPEDVAVKHFVDSLTAYDEELFQTGISVIDVGTGAGFPGLPLKILCPGIKLTLMDSLNKRVNFLQAVVDDLGLTGVHCVHARAEEGARNKLYREQFDVAVSRAVARLPVLAEYLLPFVKIGGTALALKGKEYEQEMAEAGKAVKILGGGHMKARPVTLPGLEDVRAVVYLSKFTRTARTYPRKAGTPAKQPL